MGRPRTHPLPSPAKKTQQDLRELAKSHKDDPTVVGLCGLMVGQIYSIQEHTRSGNSEAAARVRKGMELSSRTLAKLLTAAATQ